MLCYGVLRAPGAWRERKPHNHSLLGRIFQSNFTLMCRWKFMITNTVISIQLFSTLKYFISDVFGKKLQYRLMGGSRYYMFVMDTCPCGHVTALHGFPLPPTPKYLRSRLCRRIGVINETSEMPIKKKHQSRKHCASFFKVIVGSGG